MKPRLLDLFCGAGGCAMGYHRAGFDVVGVDVEPMPRYPFPFIHDDALEVMRHMNGGWTIRDVCGKRYGLKDFAVIHASPPCQAYSRSRNNGTNSEAVKLIVPVRKLLQASGKPFVIENVEGSPLNFPLMICGAIFGLSVFGMDLPRHRLFECSHLLLSPACCHRRGKTIGVYGNGTNSYHRAKLGRCITDAEKKEAMGIGWMTRKELTQAIPPAYTEFIGKQLLRVIQ